MFKKIFTVLYTVLTAISLYIIGAIFAFIIETDAGFKLSFYLFDTTNSFLLMSIVILSLIMGFINIFVFSDDQIIQSKKTITVSQTDSLAVEEEINQQIKNKYDDKIADISQRIKSEIKKQTNESSKLEKGLWSLCNEFELSQGLVYRKDEAADVEILQLKSTYAYIGLLENINRIEVGIGLNGQVAKSGNFVYLKDVPRGYMKIVSGLGEVSPDFLLIIPIHKNEKLTGLVELAGLGHLNAEEVKTVKDMAQTIFTTIL